MPTHLYRKVGGTLVEVYGDSGPTTEEWNSYVEFCLQQRGKGVTGVCSFTEGGGPDGKQRRDWKRMAEATDSAPTAVITPSVFARALTNAAASLFNLPARMFAPDAIEEAMDHARVPRADRPAIMEAVAEMRREMGI